MLREKKLEHLMAIISISAFTVERCVGKTVFIIALDKMEVNYAH